MHVIPPDPIHVNMNDEDDDDVATVTSELSYDEEDVMPKEGPEWNDGPDRFTVEKRGETLESRRKMLHRDASTKFQTSTTKSSHRRNIPPLVLIDWYYDAKVLRKVYDDDDDKNAPIKCKKNKHKTLNIQPRQKVIPVDFSKSEKYKDVEEHKCNRTPEENTELERILHEQLMENFHEQMMGESPNHRHQENQILPASQPHSSYTSRLSRGWHTFQRQTLGFLKKMIV